MPSDSESEEFNNLDDMLSDAASDTSTGSLRDRLSRSKSGLLALTVKTRAKDSPKPQVMQYAKRFNVFANNSAGWRYQVRNPQSATVDSRQQSTPNLSLRPLSARV